MRNLIFILFLISCNQIEKTNLGQNKGKQSISIKHDNIDHFFYFKKGMTVYDVESVLHNNKIKYSNLRNASKILNDFSFVNDDFEIKNQIRYIEINNFVFADNNFGKLYVFFINNELYRLAIRNDFYNSLSSWKEGHILNNWLNLYFKPIETIVKNLERKYSNNYQFGSTNVDSIMSQPQLNFYSGAPSMNKEIINKVYHIYFGSTPNENLTNSNLYIEVSQNYYYEDKNNTDFVEHYFHELFVDFRSISINKFIQNYLNNKRAIDSTKEILKIQKEKKMLDNI